MELYPICDENFQTFPSIWYLLSSNNESPFMRVGHTINFVRSNNSDSNGKLYLIGGANPSGCFNDVFILNLDSFMWEKLADEKCLKVPRYEHSCFLDDQLNPSKLFVFGGAGQEHNHNDIHCFDLNEQKWIDIKISKGKSPSARTQHVGCVFRNELVVFSGGEVASKPVSDEGVHIFNFNDQSWRTIEIDGQVPNCRHGHLMINFNDQCIYLHGGMNENKFYNDLWKLDLDARKWTKVKQPKVNIPQARAAHGGIATEKYLYIYGGLNEDANALGDFWCFNIDTNIWSVVKISGDNPTPRLDYAYCKMVLNKKIVKEKQNENVCLKVEDDENEMINQPKLVSVFEVAQSGDDQLPKDDTKFVLNNSALTATESNGNLNLKQNEENTSNKKDFESVTHMDNLTLSEGDSSKNSSELVTYFVIHGGMDTEGNIYDDCFLISLE